MTTTNNNREYAIRLYYEIREADNSLNCKTSYKVFDNMQDAANYAIDFIANNPDANIRLSNEHFNGSQISVYGDSPTKHYNLTDADINAVRNVEINEADVEDYAVTEEAQDVATNSEIRNANTASGNYSETIYTDVRNGRKIFESVTYKNHSIVRVEAPGYGLTLNIKANGNKVFKHNGRRIAAKAVAEVYMNRERADEQNKIFSAIFTPYHFGLQNRHRVMFTVNVYTNFADSNEHHFYAEFENYGDIEPFMQEVKTLADELNIPVEVLTEARYNKYPQATAWQDPHQYGEYGNLEHARDISVYCNEPPATPTVETGNYYSAHIYFYRANPPKGYSNNALTVEEFDSAKDAADFIIKFAAKHTITAATIFTADAEYRLTEADFNALYPIDEPPTPPSDDNTDDDEPILCEEFFTKTYHVLGALRITHFNSLEEAIRSAEAEIVDNDRLSHVQVARMSKGGNIEIVADFEQGYKPQPPTTPTVEESADEEDFAREYSQAAEATERIRQIDPNAEILFAEDEEPAERFILTTSDNSIANCSTAAEAEDLFYVLQDDKNAPVAYAKYPTHEKFPNGEILRSPYGTWSHIESEQYGADIYRNGLGGVDFVIRDDAGEKSFVTEDEFFAEMVKRGACSIDTPEPPADDFAAQLARLRNAQDAAKLQRDIAQDAFNKAQSAWQNAQYDVIDFLNDTSQNLRDQLLGEDIFSAYITVTAHDGKLYPNQGLGHIWIDFLFKERKFGITCDWKNFATYDTPEQVTAAIELLRAAIADGATEFTFPTVDELDSVRNVAAAVDKLNANAPDGWEVIYDAEGKNFSVTCAGQSVAELDSLALAKVLPPDKFFGRFTPNVDNQHYAEQLHSEYEELLHMRDQLSDAERIKILDGLIEDIKREMLNANLGLPTLTPTSAC